MKETNIGSSFDDFLEEEGIKEEVTIEAYKKVVESLKAERLEMAKSIFNNWKYSDNDLTCNYCIHCEFVEGVDENFVHEQSCVVLEAEKIIEAETE